MQATNERVSATAGPGIGALRELIRALFSVGRQASRLHPADPLDRAGAIFLGRLADMEPARLSDLAPHLGLDLSTVSRQVRTLVDAGYLGRVGDPVDRRACRLSLTDSGRAVLAEILDNRAAAVAPALADWTPDDVATLTRLLDRLATDLRGDRALPQETA